MSSNICAIVNSRNKPSKLFTLVIVRDKNLVLLGFKKRGFGVGKWNGFGGKVEPGENILDAAKRELTEECGLTAKSLKKHGVLWFENEDRKDVQLYEVHLFTTTSTDYEGEIVESEEMRPKWFSIQDIPYDNMWPSTRYWLPVAMDGKKFDAFFSYENDDSLRYYEMSFY